MRQISRSDISGPQTTLTMNEPLAISIGFRLSDVQSATGARLPVGFRRLFRSVRLVEELRKKNNHRCMIYRLPDGDGARVVGNGSGQEDCKCTVQHADVELGDLYSGQNRFEGVLDFVGRCKVVRVPSEGDDIIRRATVSRNRSSRLPPRENTEGRGGGFGALIRSRADSR